MGTVYAEITLKNAGDLVRARDGCLREQELRKTSVNAVVDTGAVTLVISDELCEKLGLEIQDIVEVTLANNAKETCKIAEAVEIQWKQRKSICRPWVLPGTEEVLLGAIPLEDMDLMVDPRNQELIGRHGDKQLGIIYQANRGSSFNA